MTNGLLFRAAGKINALELYEDRLVIVNTTGCLFLRRTSRKTISYTKISAVEYSPAGGMGAGYLQLVIAGSPERKGGTIAAMGDENTVVFRKKDEWQFEKARQMIEERLS
jgi:hypothetical protein